jgi:protein-disulfide isomerase
MPFRTPIGALALGGAVVASAPLRSAVAAEFAPEQRRAIEGVVHDYLLQHPDLLIETLQKAEAKHKSDAGKAAKEALAARRGEIFDDPQTPVGGNPQGDVTLVEFFDYRRPYCKKVQPSVQKLRGEDPKLRIACKEFPILGPVSVAAARAALAARRQGKYEAFHNAMMAATGEIAEDTIFKVAGLVGLDLGRLKRDMAAPEIGAALKANLALADALGVGGTPTFVIGDQLVPGAVDLASLEELVAQARKNNQERKKVHGSR